MRSIGVFVKGRCLAYLYPSKGGKWKFRSTETIETNKRDGSKGNEVYRTQQTYSSAQEALPFALRFIKRYYGTDTSLLPKTDVELKRVPYSGRVSPADTPSHLVQQLEDLLKNGPQETLFGEDDDDDDEAPAAPEVDEEVNEEEEPAESGIM
jgi:hypothetical protein